MPGLLPLRSYSPCRAALGRSIEDDGYLNSNSDARQRNKNSFLSSFLNRFRDTQPGTLILVRHGELIASTVATVTIPSVLYCTVATLVLV